MDLQKEFPRQRKDFGVHPTFNDTGVTCFHFEEVEKCENFAYIPKKTREFQCIKPYSSHEVNTEEFVEKNSAVNHLEGGWPDNVKQAQDKQRYIRKIQADIQFAKTCCVLVSRLEEVVDSNLCIDLYETYFENAADDFSLDPPQADTICSVKDSNSMDFPRSVVSIAWHPENSNKFAVAYSVTDFEKSNAGNVPLPSYIWDVNKTLKHDMELLPESPLTCLKFNPKRPDELVGGCYNGVVVFWDIRQDKRPKYQSRIGTYMNQKNEKLSCSHTDPVYDIAFIQSRTGSEFCSISSDGVVLWWDVIKNNLSEPVDRFELIDPETGIKHGASSLEYRLDAGGTKYLIGTETGLVFCVERKAKKDQESQKTIKAIYGKNTNHLGPIYSVSRNYAAVKGFLTAGDWGCCMWTEEVRTPNFRTPYCDSLVNCGIWSPTRFGVFFVGSSSGYLDIWDYNYTQEAPVWSQRIRESCAVTSVVPDPSGTFLAIGDAEGGTTILQLSRSLIFPSSVEKQNIKTLFDREGLREKTLNQSIKAKQASHGLLEKKSRAKKAVLEDRAERNEKIASRFSEKIEDIERKFTKIIEQNEPEPLDEKYMKYININPKLTSTDTKHQIGSGEELPSKTSKKNDEVTHQKQQKVEKKIEPIKGTNDNVKPIKTEEPVQNKIKPSEAKVKTKAPVKQDGKPIKANESTNPVPEKSVKPEISTKSDVEKSVKPKISTKPDVQKTVNSKTPTKAPSKSEIPKKAPVKSEIPKKAPAKSEIPKKAPAKSEIPTKAPVKSEIPKKPEVEKPVKPEIPTNSDIKKSVNLEKPTKSNAEKSVNSEISTKPDVGKSVKSETPTKQDIEQPVKSEAPKSSDIKLDNSKMPAKVESENQTQKSKKLEQVSDDVKVSSTQNDVKPSLEKKDTKAPEVVDKNKTINPKIEDINKNDSKTKIINKSDPTKTAPTTNKPDVDSDQGDLNLLDELDDNM